MDDKQRIEYFMSEIVRLSNQVVDLQNERDALAAQVEALREVANDAIHFASTRKDKVCADPMFVMQQLQNRIDATPEQHLAQIRAEAGRAGFIAGAEMLCDCGVESQYKADCLIGIETDADRYEVKIRNAGTWLKDSNVNGGKRKGGE